MRTQWTLLLAATLTISAAGAALSQTGPSASVTARPSCCTVKGHQQHQGQRPVVKQDFRRNSRQGYRFHAPQRRHVVRPISGTVLYGKTIKHYAARQQWHRQAPRQCEAGRGKAYEFKARMRERWNKMTPAERQAFINKMHERRQQRLQELPKAN